MKNKLLLYTLMSLFGFLPSSSKAAGFEKIKEQVLFWTGTGPDSSILVIRFASSDFDSTLAWGVLHNGAVTIASQLDTIGKYDKNVTWEPMGSFLDYVQFAHHQGRNGENDHYWGIYTFDRQQEEWQSNLGLVQSVAAGSLHGLSFTDFMPEIKPGNPIPAYPPHLLQLSDWEHDSLKWFGSGSNKALLLIDFCNPDKWSRVFGVKFEGEIDGLGLLEAVAELDTQLSFEGQSFLMDLFYGKDSGLFANPNYWGTWSASNFGDWTMNLGLSTKVPNGGFFACTYTDFEPPLRPNAKLKRISAPSAPIISVKEVPFVQHNAFPNPFTSTFKLIVERESEVSITDSRGALLSKSNYKIGEHELGKEWKAGVYFITTKNEMAILQTRIVKCQ